MTDRIPPADVAPETFNDEQEDEDEHAEKDQKEPAAA